MDNIKKNGVEKRKREYENRKKNTKILVMASLAFIAIISAGAFVALSMNGSDTEHSETQNGDSVHQTDTEVFIPLSELNTDATYYTYDSAGVDIRYFALKDADGYIHVAFDSCDLCYDAGKGYAQIDDVMRCQNCGLQFPIESIGTENIGGGCWPSYLPIRFDEENAIIKISDLEVKRYMFE